VFSLGIDFATAISGIDIVASKSCFSLYISIVMLDSILDFSVQVGMAAFDLRSASLHLSQYIETSSSYQNTKTLLRFYDPSVIIVPPNKLAADGMVGVSELVDRCYSTVRKVKFSVPWPMDSISAQIGKIECICL